MTTQCTDLSGRCESPVRQSLTISCVVKFLYFLVNHFSTRVRSEGLTMSFAFTTLAVFSMISLIPSGTLAVTSTLMSAFAVDVFGDCVFTTVFAAGRLRGSALFCGTTFFADAFFAPAFFAAGFFLGCLLSFITRNSSTNFVSVRALSVTFYEIGLHSWMRIQQLLTKSPWQ